MTAKLFVFFLVIFNIFHTLRFQSVAVEQCSPEEASTIVQEFLNLVNEKINSTSLIIQQQVSDTQNKVPNPNEQLELEQALNHIKTELNNLKQNICTKAFQLQFDYKTLKIDSLLAQCATTPSTKAPYFQTKAETALAKIQYAKAKAELALQKCAIKNTPAGCSAVRTCCEQYLTKTTSKMDSKVNKIAKTGTESYNCLRKAIREALELESDIKEEMLECRLQGIVNHGHSSESIWSAQVNKLHTSPAIQDNTFTQSNENAQEPSVENVSKPELVKESVNEYNNTAVSEVSENVLTNQQPNKNDENINDDKLNEVNP